MTAAFDSPNQNDSPAVTSAALSAGVRAARVRPGFLFHPGRDSAVALQNALVVLLAGVLALLWLHWSTTAAITRSTAQQYAIQAFGIKARGEIETSYGWSEGYKAWLEWDSRRQLAAAQNDKAAAQRYAAVRDRASQLSPLLAAPYFDPATGKFPNLRAYEANTYLIDSVRLREQFLHTMGLSDEMGNKANAFALQLVLLGVALALYQFVPAPEDVSNRWFRILPMGAAALLVVGVAAWCISVVLTPLPTVSSQAIQDYANGVGLAYQEDYHAAITAFDKALQADPAYADAYFRRGNAYFALQDYAGAAADFQAAMDAGAGGASYPWNLGWTYYLLGKPAESIAATQQAMELAPEQPALDFNLGLAQLARGDTAAADEAYQAGLAKVVKMVMDAKTEGQEAAPSLWAYLDTAVGDLRRFSICMGGGACRESAPRASTPVSDNLIRAADNLRDQLESSALMLEYRGTPPPPPNGAQVGKPEFGYATLDGQGQVAGLAPLSSPPPAAAAGPRFGLAQAEEQSSYSVDSSVNLAAGVAAPVYVKFPFANLVDGQLFVIKVYHQGAEMPYLRLVDTWKLGASGDALLPISPGSQFTLDPGQYSVDFTVDGHAVQTGAFEILDPSAHK